MTNSRVRAICWILFVVVTVLILLFPVQLVSQTRPIQAPYIFSDLPVFSLLFCLWIIVFAFLASSRRDDRPNWEHLVLASVLGVVFIGFWVYIVYPYGSYADDIYNTGHVRYIVEEGHFLAGHPILAYFDYPGMHTLVAALSEISGLGIFETRTLFLIFNAAFFCAIMYLVFSKWLQRSRLAVLAVLLLLMTGGAIIDKMRIFTPGALSLSLLAVFLAIEGLSTESLGDQRRHVILLELVVFSALTVSYFATSLLIPLALLGGLAVHRLSGRLKPSSLVPTILLLSVVLLAWLVLYTWHTSRTLANLLPDIAGSVRSGEFLTSMGTLAQANVGGELPFWANVTRLLWWFLLGAATVIALYGLLDVKRLTSAERVEIGALLGVLALTGIGMVGSREGVQFYRYLLYAPFFCIAPMISFLVRRKAYGRTLLAALAACAIVSSLPFFLTSVNTVATDAIYSYEVSSGVLLEAHSRNAGEDIIIYRTSTTTASWAFHYLPNVLFRNLPESVYYAGEKEAFWQYVDEMATEFLDTDSDNERQKIFAVDEKAFDHAQHLLAISADDPGWQNFDSALWTTGWIYNNGHVQMYTP